MKNILFLSSWYPSRVHTTLGNFVNYHAKSVALKNKVNLLYIVPDDKIIGYELDHFKIDNITTTIVYFKRGVFRYLNYFIAFLKGLNFLLREKQETFDLVHMNVTYPASWQAIYLRFKYKLPFIISEHWHGFQNLSNQKIGFFKNIMIRYAFKYAYAVCPVTKELQIAMQKQNLKANYNTVPNVVDTSMFKIGKKEADQFTFLHVSTLEDDIKNVSGIIDAFKELKLNNIKLRIIGDGKTDWIKKIVDDIKLTNQIDVIGEKTHEQIANEMQLANAFVLFSNIETFSIVIIEALSCGLPIISTNVGVVKEIYSKSIGELVEINNTNELTNAMKHVFDNYSSYNPQTIRDYAINNFSYENIGDQFNELYKKMIKN